MTLADLFRFYLGDGETIRRLAADPWVLAVGAPLVLSAGLARYYDAHDLRRQWWRLLVPFAVSTLAAAGLFLVVVLASRSGLDTLPLGLGLLGLFWLTAPFAWLYGLPFERLGPPPWAARARRVALAVVAAGRVALMARCVSVLLVYNWWGGLLVVACFAAPAALLAVAAAMLVLRRPEDARPAVAGAARQVMNVMSGIRDYMPQFAPIPPPPGAVKLEPMPESAAGFLLGCLAIPLLVFSSVLLPRLIGSPRHGLPALAITPSAPPAPGVWIAVALAVLFWVPWLFLRHPAQRRRSEFVRRLRFGDLKETMRDLAALRPEDFPPHWDPAAALARADFASRMRQAVLLASELSYGSWVRFRFLERFGQMLPIWLDPSEIWFYSDPREVRFVEEVSEGRWKHKDRMPEDQLRELAELRDLLDGLPEGREIVEPYQEYLANLCEHLRERDPPRAQILEGLLALSLKRGSKR